MPFYLADNIKEPISRNMIHGLVMHLIVLYFLKHQIFI